MGGAEHRETEVKLPVGDLRAARARLRREGARPGKRVHEMNTLYDTREGAFRSRGELLRLRLQDGAAVVTFKGRALPSRGGAGRYKVREETEFAVGNAAVIGAALRQLGLRPGFRYEKYRTHYRWPDAPGVEVVLDETPAGNFLELEGPPAAIDRAARRLGYGPKDYITASYAALHLADCLRRGRAASHMLFPRRKKSRKPSVLR